jgi:CHAT domain-containing protein
MGDYFKKALIKHMGITPDDLYRARMKRLEELLSMAEHDPKRLDKVLKHKERISPELAAVAEEVAKHAIDQEKWPLFQAASQIASDIYRCFGMVHEFLACQLNICQLYFAQAAAVQDYQSVASSANDIYVQALLRQDESLMLHAGMLTANCHYFASEIAENGINENERQDLLVEALEDIIDAALCIHNTQDTVVFQQFVSLAAALLKEIIPDILLTLKQEVQDLLVNLEEHMQRLVPLAYESQDGPEKSIHIAQQLAELSYRCGNAAAANTRLDIAISREPPPNLLETWAHTVYQRYEGTRDSNVLNFDDLLVELEAYIQRLVPDYESLDDPRVEALFVELEAYIQRLGYESLDDPEKSIHIAQQLAELYYGYGNMANANARLSSAIKTWLKIRLQGWQPTHKRTRDPNLPAEELSTLRHLLRSRTEQMRLLYRSRSGRLWSALVLDGYLGEFLRDELKEGRNDPVDVFRAIDVMKARVLLDQISGRFQDFPTPELAEQATQLERQFLKFGPDKPSEDEDKEEKLRNAEVRLLSLSRLPINTGMATDAERSLDHLLMSLEDLCMAYNGGFHSTEPLVDLSEVMHTLQPGEAMIVYCIPYHWVHESYEIVVITITTEKAQTIHVPLQDLPGWKNALVIKFNDQQPYSHNVLGDYVWQLRVNIQMALDTQVEASLEKLHDILIAPLLNAGFLPQQFRRWIIVPHGVLHYVPFAALPTSQGHHLIEDVALTVIPSASVWCKLQAQKRAAVKSFLGLANPDLPYANLPLLPDAEKELAKVLKSLASLQCHVYTEKEATEETLMKQAAGKSILHLATHGDFPEQDVIDLHRVLLASTEAYDGMLNAEEVRKMDLHAARLVVLSICNGGLYRVGPGDEPFGLMSALLTAGAENVIGTLWPLDDRMGRLFMIEFYKNLLQYGPAEALRQASRQFIQDKARLKDWASFVLVGVGRPWSQGF